MARRWIMSKNIICVLGCKIVYCCYCERMVSCWGGVRSANQYAEAVVMVKYFLTNLLSGWQQFYNLVTHTQEELAEVMLSCRHGSPVLPEINIDLHVPAAEYHGAYRDASTAACNRVHTHTSTQAWVWRSDRSDRSPHSHLAVNTVLNLFRPALRLMWPVLIRFILTSRNHGAEPFLKYLFSSLPFGVLTKTVKFFFPFLCSPDFKICHW
jgi:hypothetical protein